MHLSLSHHQFILTLFHVFNTKWDAIIFESWFFSYMCKRYVFFHVRSCLPMFSCFHNIMSSCTCQTSLLTVLICVVMFSCVPGTILSLLTAQKLERFLFCVRRTGGQEFPAKWWRVSSALLDWIKTKLGQAREFCSDFTQWKQPLGHCIGRVAIWRTRFKSVW